MMIIVTITYSITTSLPFILLPAAVIHSHFDQQKKGKQQNDEAKKAIELEKQGRIMQRKLSNRL